MPFLKINTPPKPKPPPHRCIKPGGDYSLHVGVGSLYQCPICALVWRKEGAFWEVSDLYDGLALLPVPDPLEGRDGGGLDELAIRMERERTQGGLL